MLTPPGPGETAPGFGEPALVIEPPVEVPTRDPMLDSLDVVAAIENADEQRKQFVTLMPQLRQDMDDERASSVLTMVESVQDPQNRHLLLGQLISYQPIYEHPIMRDYLRREEDYALRAKVCYVEAKIADESARQWIRSTFLQGADPVRGVTTVTRVLPTLIMSSDAAADAELIEILRDVDGVIERNGAQGVDLQQLVWPKLQSLPDDRRATYEQFFDGRKR